MKVKPIYIVLISIVTCLISSCNSDSPDSNETGKGAQVTFDVSDLTRGSVTTSFNKFAVYGDMKYHEDTNSTPIVLFNKTEVEYKNGSWKYEGVQYWFHNHEHSFVGIAPLSVLAISNLPTYSDSRLSFAYSIPTSGNKVSANTDVTDIIAATHRRLYNDRDDNHTTTFQFVHIMSLINIAPALNDNIMTEEEFITIHKVEFAGFKTKANFNITPASILTNKQTNDMVVEVNGHSGSANLTIEFAEGKKIKNDRKNVSLFDANDAVIMIPQTFGTDSGTELHIAYSINNDPTVKHINLPLNGQKWDSGKSYTYKFTINRTGAQFENTTISDWDVFDTGNFDAH